MKQLFTLLVLIFMCGTTEAQVAAYPFAQSIDTYQIIAGTVVDAPNVDDVFYANLPIGFSFIFNGTTTDKFGVGTNGYIVMDSLIHNAFNYVISTQSTNQISAAQCDLMNNNIGGTIEYATVGTAPNRVLIIQWKNYGIFGLSFCHLNFQIRLFETSNCVQMYYGFNGVSGSGKKFYVGLVGNSSADYNLRTTTNNWTQTSTATTFPGTGNFIGPISTLPNGLVYSYGGCIGTGLQFSYLSGQVFNDANNNGTADAGEPGIPNIIIHEGFQNSYATTDASGNYALFFLDSTKTYSLSSTAPNYWNLTTTPIIQTVAPLTQTTNNKNFGMFATPNIHDVAITGWSSNLPWPTAYVQFYGTYTNNGTVTESDTVFFTADTLLTFISATPAPSFINGNVYGWLYTNLQVNQTGNIHITLKADSFITVGDTLYSNWFVQPYSIDIAQANNNYNVIQPCLSSFDPNEKSVMPFGDVAANTDLTYTIKFQNTGTFQAHNIFIRDTLNTNLEVATFDVLGYSHNMIYTINGQGNVEFVFANINLPDSNSNEPASHGYVKYKIKQKQNLTAGTSITNTASIYFDFNAPVATNTTLNMVKEAGQGNGINNILTNSPLSIYPNPVTDLLTLVLPSAAQASTVLIYNAFGQQVYNYTTSNVSSVNIVTKSFQKGMYLIQLQNNNKTTHSKFMKL
jgi:uncharacterized repeat protein (TIGR01451 family)